MKPGVSHQMTHFCSGSSAETGSQERQSLEIVSINTGDQKKASICSVTLFLSVSHSLSGMSVCVCFIQGLESHLSNNCESYSDSPPSALRRCTKLSRISEKYATVSTLEHCFLKVTPHKVTLKVIPHIAAPVRSVYRNQEPLVFHFYTSFLLHCRNRKEPKQTHVFNSSCHQHSVKLSKTKNSLLSQIQNLLAAKIH